MPTATRHCHAAAALSLPPPPWPLSSHCRRHRQFTIVIQFVVTFLAVVAFIGPSSLSQLWSHCCCPHCGCGHLCCVVVTVVVLQLWLCHRHHCLYRCLLVVVIASSSLLLPWPSSSWTMALRWRQLGKMGSVSQYIGNGVDAVACRKWCGSWPHGWG